MPNKIEAIVFDLDGTLLDTLSNLANCYNRVLADQGLQTHETEAYRHFIGDGARRCLTRCLDASNELDRLSETEVDQLLEKQQKDYRTSWSSDVSIYSGINPLIESIQTNNLPLAVLTNKDQEFAINCVNRFFPRGTFQCVQGFDQSVPHKPNPTGALMVAKALNVKPENMVLIGDTAVDINTAKSANFVSIGALWGFRDRAELVSAGADHIVTTPAEVLEIVFT